MLARTQKVTVPVLLQRRTKKEDAIQRQKHTTGGIPRWSPTLVLVARFSAYVWQSRRDAQFSLTYGRMYCLTSLDTIYYSIIFHS
jgi:hypothetical protein